MHALLLGVRPVSLVLLIIGVNACVVVAPRHDYPKEYPLAESFGACPNLNGAFENTGTRLSEEASSPSGPILLTSLLLAPKAIPSGALVTSLQMHGPAQGSLQVEVLTAEGPVANWIMPSAPKADGFMDSKPFSSFVCDHDQGANLVVTNDPVTVTTKGSTYKVAVRIYRAKDGSLIVGRERIYTDFSGGVDVARQWFRFQEAHATPPSVVQ